MSRLPRSLVAVLLTAACAPVLHTADRPGARLVARAPTASEEWASLDENLHELAFLKAHGYTVALPDHPAVNALRDRAAPATAEERKALRAVFEREIYDARAYAEALRRIPSSDPRLAEVFARFDEWHRLWGFDAKAAYTVRLTLYGPGGEYYSDLATVKLLTDRKGWFKRNDDPFFTIIHEMVHIGTDGPIVRRFGLGHWEKERLADLVVARAFGHLLPGYAVTREGPADLDALVTDEALKDLPGAIAPWAASQATKAVLEGRPQVVRLSPADGARDVPTNTTEIEAEFNVDMDTGARLCVKTPCGDSGICFKSMGWKSPRILTIAADRPLPAKREYWLSLGVDGCELQAESGKSMPPRPWAFTTR